MNHSDIAALMKGAAPAIRDFVAASIKPLADRIIELERQLEAARSVDLAAMVNDAVGQAITNLPPAQPGKDADPELVAQLVADAVNALPPAQPGRDAEPETVRSMVAKAVAELPPAAPGRDADMDAVRNLIAESVASAVLAIEPRGPDAELLRAVVADEVAQLPPPAPGKDADPEEARRLVDEAVTAAVAALPVPPPGKDADPDAVAALVAEKVAEAINAMPPAEAGKSVSPEDVAPMLAALVADEIAKLPPAEAGKSVDIADVAELVAAEVTKAVTALPAPEPGEPGAPGKLPVVKAWEDRVYYEAECCVFDGASYQASKDTGRAPPHEDWTCVAKSGRDGLNGRSLRIRGTYTDVGDYGALDLVALNGGSFVAKTDDPGPCPGDGWQLVVSRGKPGAPGEGRKGDPGIGKKGDPGAPVVSADIDDQGMLTLLNGDGTAVQCDLYPLLSKIGGRA